MLDFYIVFLISLIVILIRKWGKNDRLTCKQ